MNDEDRELVRKAVKALGEAGEALRPLAMTPEERTAEEVKERKKRKHEIRQRAERIARCGESRRGHKWEGSTDDGGYYFCTKCNGHTNEGIPLVFLSFYDRVSGASEARTLRKDLQDRVCLGRGLVYPGEKVKEYG